MVVRAAHPRRIFLEHAQAGKGLARVEQDRAGARDRIDIARASASRCPDRCWSVLSADRSAVSIARALPARRISDGAVLDAIAVLRQLLDRDIGIERAEESRGDVQAGDARSPAGNSSRL